jgi:hypothetical protein
MGAQSDDPELVRNICQGSWNHALVKWRRQGVSHRCPTRGCGPLHKSKWPCYTSSRHQGFTPWTCSSCNSSGWSPTRGKHRHQNASHDQRFRAPGRFGFEIAVLHGLSGTALATRATCAGWAARTASNGRWDVGVAASGPRRAMWSMVCHSLSDRMGYV